MDDEQKLPKVEMPRIKLGTQGLEVIAYSFMYIYTVK